MAKQRDSVATEQKVYVHQCSVYPSGAFSLATSIIPGRNVIHNNKLVLSGDIEKYMKYVKEKKFDNDTVHLVSCDDSVSNHHKYFVIGVIKKLFETSLVHGCYLKLHTDEQILEMAATLRRITGSEAEEEKYEMVEVDQEKQELLNRVFSLEVDVKSFKRQLDVDGEESKVIKAMRTGIEDLDTRFVLAGRWYTEHSTDIKKLKEDMEDVERDTLAASNDITMLTDNVKDVRNDFVALDKVCHLQDKDINEMKQKHKNMETMQLTLSTGMSNLSTAHQDIQRDIIRLESAVITLQRERDDQDNKNNTIKNKRVTVIPDTVWTNGVNSDITTLQNRVASAENMISFMWMFIIMVLVANAFAFSGVLKQGDVDKMIESSVALILRDMLQKMF